MPGIALEYLAKPIFLPSDGNDAIGPRFLALSIMVENWSN